MQTVIQPRVQLMLPFTPPAVPSVEVLILKPCTNCDGTGEWRMQTGPRFSDYWAGKCKPCNGTGQRVVRA